MTDEAATFWGNAKAEQSQQHALTVLQTEDTAPDQAAEHQRLAKRAGVPVGVVASDSSGVRRQVARDELGSLAQSAPALATWATAPENYAVAKDDLGPMERMAHALVRPLDLNRAAGAGLVRTIGSTIKGAADLEGALSRRFLGLLGADDATMAYLRAFNPIDVAADRAIRPAGGMVKRAADAIDVPQERQGFDTDLAGGLGQLGGQVGQAMLAPETLFPSLLSLGADQMDERVQAANKEGTARGDLAILGGAGVTGILERFGLDKLLHRLPPSIRNAATKRVADALIGGGIEAGQEAAENVGQDLLTRALLDRDYQIGEGLRRQVEAAGGTGAIARLLLQFLPGYHGHRQALAEREALDGMVRAADATRTRARAPEAFEGAVEQVAPDRFVYAPAEALAEHFRGHENPAAAIDTLTGQPGAYAEAMATGAEVAIPLPRYLSQIGTEAHAALAGRLRLSPGEDVKPDSSIPQATEADIAAAMAEARAAEPTGPVPDAAPVTDTHRHPLFTDAELADDWGGYQAAVAAADAERRANAARDQEATRARAADKLLREKTRTAVEAELRQHPVYKAGDALRKREQGIKLDHAAVVAQVGEERAAKLKGMTLKRGGVSPDEAAAVLGYPSGAKLVHDLATAPAFAEMARVETDARLQTPARSTDVDIATDAQADMLLREVQAFENRNGGIRTHNAVLREAARRLIEGKAIRNVQPNVYRLAEAKAGREAFHAASKGNWQEAIAARRRQLLNLHLYREARNAREEVTRGAKYLAQFGKRSIRQKIGLAGADYLEQIDGLLRGRDFAPITGPQIDARTSLAKWIKAKAQEGIIVDVPPSVADEAFRVPFKRMKVGEFRELRDAVEHIAHLANTANMIRLGEKLLDRHLVDEAMAHSVATGNRQRARNTGDRTLRSKAREELLKARTVTGAATDIARELDGFKDGGAVWQHTVGIMREANERTLAELEAAQKATAEIKLRHYSPAELRAMAKDKRHFPGIGDWSKARVLALALNWGNTGNREAILTQVRDRLSPEDVGTLLHSLDARDWAFVREVWAQINSYWPQIAETAKRRTGLAPAKVEASPFTVTTADGETLTLPGGYFPLRYELSTVKTMAQAADDYYKQVRTGATVKAATRDGHTIERIGSAGNSVKLELSVIDSHLRDVIRDLYLGDAVNAVHTALRGKAFASAVDDAASAPLVKGLQTWLKDVASGEIGVDSFGERAVRMTRVNFTAAALTWKATSAALQITGLTQSAVVLGKGPIMDGIARYARRPRSLHAYVDTASPYMARRAKTHIEAVHQVMTAEAGRFRAGQAAMIRWGYYMLGRVQMIVDDVTWLAAEKVGMQKFAGDVKKARTFADDAVSRAQGSGDFIDKTAFQRGTVGDKVRQSEYIRAASALQGYMLAKGNIAYEQIRTKRPHKLAENMVMLFVVDAMLAQVIRHGLPEDEDKDGWRIDDFIARAAKEGGSAVMGTVPGLGALASELRGYDSKGVVASAMESVANAYEQTSQGKLDKALVKSYAQLAGFAFGFPAGAFKSLVETMAAMRTAQARAPADVSGKDWAEDAAK